MSVTCGFADAGVWNSQHGETLTASKELGNMLAASIHLNEASALVGVAPFD